MPHHTCWCRDSPWEARKLLPLRREDVLEVRHTPELLDKNVTENTKHFKSGRPVRHWGGGSGACSGMGRAGVAIGGGGACKGDLQMMKGGP